MFAIILFSEPLAGPSRLSTPCLQATNQGYDNVSEIRAAHNAWSSRQDR